MDEFEPQKAALGQIMQMLGDRVGERLKRVTITIDSGEGEEPEEEMEEEGDPFMSRLKKHGME